MSILEKITSILDGIEEMNGKLDRLLASKINIDPIALEEATAPQRTDILKIAKDVKKGFKTVEHEKEPNGVEEVEQDFSGVLVMRQTEKGLLVVKKGMQQWLAKSFIKGGGDGYDNGNTYDVELVEKSPKSGKPVTWLLKKWVKFEVVKN